MVLLNKIEINPPLINSSCAWSSDLVDLTALYESPYTGAITTRTATFNGYGEDKAINTVAFAVDTDTTLNSYGYSPHPLAAYLGWVETILTGSKHSITKPIIISITASTVETIKAMIDAIQALRFKLGDNTSELAKIAIELNTSCPNIPNSPPSGYTFSYLLPLLQVLRDAHSEDPTLTVGLKLPPYTYKGQFNDVISGLGLLARNKISAFAFITCTNTLGNSLLFAEQTGANTQQTFAVPTALGGIAGDAIHPLALGNVYTFKELLSSQEAMDAGIADTKIIGVGGVTSKAAAERMKKAGADVIGCATLLGKEGVHAFEILGKEL
ncbi:FMN-linked oxidoreductase [Pholiota conissans]|uniref:Dihydroorotate oxidase n=1 Tax=Pholiota conissans TaxID=109636 RepID=A0A9P5YZQ2_9AGAR|nr:FMN-linked oxidoreductase [Pholiota conissans]